MHGELLAQVAAYYSRKLAEHGPTPQGVDWRTEDSQLVRFAKLSGIFEGDSEFSILDYGCGYGALASFLQRIDAKCDYVGFDISRDMVIAARDRHRQQKEGQVRARFVGAEEKLEIADYVVASGVLNVRLGYSERDWAEYVTRTIDHLDRLSRKGYAFNMLTAFSDPERMRDDLYYADPQRTFDRCIRRHPRQVALLHDYPLYEFTILVRKSP